MSFVNIKKNKPTSPGTRWIIKTLTHKTPNKSPNMFTLTRKWHAGRNNEGRVCFRYFMKRKFRKKITLTATKLNIKTDVVSFQYFFLFNKRNSKILFWTKRGGSFVLPATTTNHPGKVYYGENSKKPLYSRSLIGLPILITLIPFYLKICCVTTFPYYKFQYATSSGAYCIKLRTVKKEKKIKIKMPSKQFKFVLPNSLVILGINLQLWNQKNNVGKAGVLRNKGEKQTVRGIAMNCVDHPHGGKANSVQPETSPWGWVTKKSH